MKDLQKPVSNERSATNIKRLISRVDVADEQRIGADMLIIAGVGQGNAMGGTAENKPNDISGRLTRNLRCTTRI
jgi:hypothetical protein